MSRERAGAGREGELINFPRVLKSWRAKRADESWSGSVGITAFWSDLRATERERGSKESQRCGAGKRREPKLGFGRGKDRRDARI